MPARTIYVIFDKSLADILFPLDSKILTKSGQEILDETCVLNIGMHVHYISMYWHPYYRGLGYEKGLCPIAEKWYAQALKLPVFPGMTDEDVSGVVRVLVAVVR